MSNFNDEFSVYAKRKLGLEAPFDQELKEEKIANVYVEEEDGNISIDVNKARETRIAEGEVCSSFTHDYRCQWQMDL